MTQSARLIFSSGDLDHLIKTSSKDEIGELANAFNQMVDDLKGKTTSIENLKAAEEALKTRINQTKDSD